MNRAYTTIGSVRGCCGHVHRTRESAEACLERDARGCASQGGYSDRAVVSDPRTYSERCAMPRRVLDVLAADAQTGGAL